jgi:hypothetical protein
MKHLWILFFLMSNITAEPVKLLILEPAIQGVNQNEISQFHHSMQMVFNQDDLFLVMSSDEVNHSYKQLGYMRPPHCSYDACFLSAGEDLFQDLVLGVSGDKSGKRLRLNLRLYGVEEKAIIWSQSFEFTVSEPQDFIHSVKSIRDDMLGYKESSKLSYSKINNTFAKSYTWSLMAGASLVGWMVYEFGPWAPKADMKEEFSSNNRIVLNRPSSGLRGFYASRPLGARFRAMGGSGITLVKSALAPIWNPAGLANIARQEVEFAREILPGGIPKQYFAYAAPLGRNIYHAQAIQYEGDELAKEIVYYSSYGTDLSLFSTYFNQAQLGINFKGYLIEVGAECIGIDCSRGSGYGYGIDFGFQWAIDRLIHFGLVLKDPLSFIQYENQLSSNKYSESLPPQVLAGVSYDFSPVFRASVDLQKAMYADQMDRISMGLEKKILDLIWLRGGLYQISDYDKFRVWTLGFGMKESHKGYLFSVNYHFEYANDNAVIFQGQQSLDFGLHF